MRKATCYVKSNRVQSQVNTLLGKVELKLDELAKEAARVASLDIANRNWSHLTNPYAKRWLKTVGQTGASENSIYYFLVNGESNYGDIADRFRRLAGEDYGGRTLEQIVFDEHKPNYGNKIMVSGFASVSLILAFWEYGHTNKFTKRKESAPIISWTAFIYYRKLKSAFRDLS